jgi:hypothetical protein
VVIMMDCLKGLQKNTLFRGVQCGDGQSQRVAETAKLPPYTFHTMLFVRSQPGKEEKTLFRGVQRGCKHQDLMW